MISFRNLSICHLPFSIYHLPFSIVRRRELDGCPVAGALQMVGDKWTMLVVRDLAAGPKRTLELLSGLFPISSRTLVGRLRDMENDQLIERRDFGGNPPH